MKYLYLTLIVFFFSCSSGNKEVSDLNKQASDLILNGSGIDKQSHEEAITLLNKAIELDDKYAVSYSNKHFALVRIGKMDEAIETLKEAVDKIDDYAEGYRNMAFVYNYQGNTKESERYFLMAAEKYNNKVNLAGSGTPEQVILRDQAELAFTKLFIDDLRQTGMNELLSMASEYPSNPNILYYVEIAKDFKKKEYIKDYYGI